MKRRKTDMAKLRVEFDTAIAEVREGLALLGHFVGEMRSLTENMKDLRLAYIRVKGEAIKEVPDRPRRKAAATRRFSDEELPEIMAPVVAYRDAHPGCTWSEIFKAVENPFKGANGLAQAFKRFARLATPPPAVPAPAREAV